MKSLQARVSAAAALVLLVFVVLTSLALERAFEASARSAREERLLGLVYVLMAAADSAGDGGLSLPPGLAEARFSLPGSGLYGQVSDGAGVPVWRSDSALGQSVPFETLLGPGRRRFGQAADAQGRAYFVGGYGVTWTIGPAPRDYTFSVAEDLSEYARELDGFRTSLARWLGAMAVLLLLALLLALRWGLAPLRRVAAEVAAVEAGRQDRLRGRYPRELRLLTGNLNALLAHAAARQLRLTNALADLAHSLKTPLAVMRGVLAEAPECRRGEGARLGEQLARMQEIVAYQLERARSRPAPALAPPVAVARALERLGAALARLHVGKAVTLALALEPGLSFRGVEGDLLEVLGNLLENAYKWCRSRVAVSGRRDGGVLVMTVEDDGPGIPPARAREVLERGARADLATPGHGIGLAVVREICEAYGGELAIGTGTLGGALVSVRLRG